MNIRNQNNSLDRFGRRNMFTADSMISLKDPSQSDSFSWLEAAHSLEVEQFFESPKSNHTRSKAKLADKSTFHINSSVTSSDQLWSPPCTKIASSSPTVPKLGAFHQHFCTKHNTQRNTSRQHENTLPTNPQSSRAAHCKPRTHSKSLSFGASHSISAPSTPLTMTSHVISSHPSHPISSRSTYDTAAVPEFEQVFQKYERRKNVPPTSPSHAIYRKDHSLVDAVSSQTRLLKPKTAPVGHASFRWHRQHLSSKPAPKTTAVSTVEKSTRTHTKKGHICQYYDKVTAIHGFLTQKNVNEILQRTNYTRRELYVIYIRFKALCALSHNPYGIDKDTFKRGVARLAVEDDLFVDRVFDLVDDDCSNSIEWEEFLYAMSALEKGSNLTKQRFFFQVYDLDGDGFISRKDLSTMFLSGSMLKNNAAAEDMCDAFVNRVFKQIGKENSDKLSLQDINDYMSRHESDGEDVWDVFGRSMLKDFTTYKRRLANTNV